MGKKRKIATARGWRQLIGFALAIVAVTGIAAQVTAQQGSSAAELQGLRIVEVTVRQDSPYLTAEQIEAMLEYTKVGAPFDEALIRADRDRINAWVVDEYGEQVVRVSVRLRPVNLCEPAADACTNPGRGVEIILDVEDTFPRIIAVRIDTEVMSEEWFLTGLDFKPGMAATEANIERIVVSLHEKIDQFVEEEGVFVIPQVAFQQVSTNDRILHFSVRKVIVNDVIVIGNQKTRDFVIQREIQTKPGDVASIGAIQGDLWRLYHLGYFEEIEPSIEATDDPLRVNLIYRVRETQTGMAGFGAGWSSASGLLGYLEFTDSNLFGRGQQLQARVEFGSKQTLYELGFTEPRLYGSRVSVGLELYNKRQSDLLDTIGEKYEERRVGGSVSLGYLFTDHLRAYVGYRMENVRHIPESGGTATFDRSRVLSLGASYDTSNMPSYPTEGIRARVDAELAGNFLGGDAQFTRLSGSISSYHRVGQNDQVFAWRVLAGTALDELPLYAMYRVGGSDTLRGYPYAAMQGDHMVVLNAEYRMPITQNRNLQLTAFVDVGNAWKFGEPVEWKDLKVSYGVGVLLLNSVAPFRIDFAVGDAPRISIGLGQMF